MADLPVTSGSGVQPMTEDELVSLLQREEADATAYYSSEIANQQAYAMDRYHGMPYNDGSEVPNRSQVVTPDIRDTINWMLPQLMRAFAPSDELISCEDDNIVENAEEERDAANYLKHVFFRDNPGEKNIHDFCFDALVQKIGVARVYWCPPEPKPPKVLEGITADQLIKYANDPNYVILEAVQDGVAELDQPGDEEGEPAEPQEPMEGGELQSEDAPQGQPGQPPSVNAMVPSGQPAMPQQPPQPQSEPTFSIKVQHRPTMGRAKVEIIPSEEFAFSRRARSLEEADYHRWQHEVFLTEIMAQFPEKAMELDPNFGTWGSGDHFRHETDQRVIARFPEESGTFGHLGRSEDNRRKVIECIEYVRVDFDGDGIVELRRVRRIGHVILENDAVARSEFRLWSPVRVAHRLVGLSIADLLMDIQKIRTALTRRALDSLAQTLTPRTYVSQQAIDKDPTLEDRILAHDVGDVIPVSGDPNAVLKTEVTPDVSPNAFAAIEYFDRRSEEASGVNRHAMGIQPQAITDTKGGIEALQAAANTRIEQVARWLGLGLEEIFQLLLATLIEHQDHARIVKINGRRMAFDPRRWSDEMTVAVHVGMAGESRERKLTYLNLIAQKQEQVLLKAGPTPLVGLSHLRNSYAEMLITMGFKDPSRFFGDIPKDWAPPQQSDPKADEAKGKLEIAQAELQQKGQIEQAKLQGQMQLQAAELQGKQQLAQYEAQMAAEKGARDVEVQKAVAAAKAETDRQMAMLKADTDRQIAEMRIAAEAQIAQQRLAAEMELARWKAQLEMQARAQLNTSNDTTIPADRPGGRLDA